MKSAKITALEDENTDLYVYGDVHNKVDEVQHFLDSVKPERVIWLGDWLDSWNDTEEDAEKTALFLENLLNKRKNDVFIQSNHDISYRFPQIKDFHYWGWTAGKNYFVNKHIDPKLWDRFVLFHFETIAGNTILFSHAGWDSHFLTSRNPSRMFKRDVARHAKEGLIACAENREHLVTHDERGPLWNRNVRPWPYCYQIFGHTPAPEPQVIQGFKTVNVCFDCAHTFAGIINKDGIYSYHKRYAQKKLLTSFEKLLTK